MREWRELCIIYSERLRVCGHVKSSLHIFRKYKLSYSPFLLLFLDKPSSMEQVHYHWTVKEEEEEEDQQQEAALIRRQSLQQHGDDHSIIASVAAPSFSSALTSSADHVEGSTSSSELKEQPTQQVEETSNVAENKNKINDDSEASGLRVITEFVENVIVNVEVISSDTISGATSQDMSSVYFDKQQGMWKCHHCTWTKQFDNPWNVWCENLNGDYSDLLMSVKTMIQHKPCFVYETKGSDIRVENSDIQCMETVDDKVPTISELPPSHNASGIQAATVEKCGDESSAKAYSNLTEEIDQQMKEYDVEAVLAKQETHDLFCPNCKSCITKRVILRKRKRNITNLDTKAKRDKSATEVDDNSVEEANQGDNAIAAPADDYEPEREPEVFRCLSCFSFFIPMRKGLKQFPSSDGTRKPEISQKPPVIPSSNVENPSIVVAESNPNWFLALFTSKKGKKASAQGEASIEDSRTDPVGQLQPVDVIKTDIVADISKPESVLVAAVATTEIPFNAGKPAKDAILKAYEGSPIFEKSEKDVDKTLEIAQDEGSSSDSSLMEKAQSPDQSYEAFKSSVSQIADDVPIEGDIVTEAHTQIDIGEQPRAEVGEQQEWEILKSIVYGGLVESITSLGVVSSAAASGTAPLSILALGLANLIGGLFVIGHNLIDLKNNHSGGDSQQTNVQYRYQELLGRREHFLLHAVVVVLSFLIFGSLPLVIYGLLIYENYYDEVKVAIVAATSVACIILLAIGKVYITRPPKSYAKTVLNYVTLALATAGMSYIAGDLVKDLLEKIIGSESGYNLTMMPLSDTTRMKPARMSY